MAATDAASAHLRHCSAAAAAAAALRVEPMGAAGAAAAPPDSLMLGCITNGGAGPTPARSLLARPPLPPGRTPRPAALLERTASAAHSSRVNRAGSSLTRVELSAGLEGCWLAAARIPRQLGRFVSDQGRTIVQDWREAGWLLLASLDSHAREEGMHSRLLVHTVHDPSEVIDTFYGVRCLMLALKEHDIP